MVHVVSVDIKQHWTWTIYTVILIMTILSHLKKKKHWTLYIYPSIIVQEFLNVLKGLFCSFVCSLFLFLLPLLLPVHRAACRWECHPGVWRDLSRAHWPDSQELPQVVQPAGGCGGVGSGRHHQHSDALCSHPICQPQCQCQYFVGRGGRGAWYGVTVIITCTLSLML